MNFLKSNVWEIDRSPSLINLGTILSILHVVNYFFWREQAHIFADPGATPFLCWNFLPNCESFFLIQHAGLLKFLFISYGVFGFLSIFSFFWRQYTGLSCTLLGVTFIHMMLLFLTDASLNQDIYSLFIVLNFIYLVIPGKASLVRALVVVFYFVSALRALTPESLSGMGLHEVMPLHHKVLEWIVCLGILIKMTLPTLLISPIGQRVLLAVLGLGAYHGLYFYFMQDFRSIVFFGLLIFFIFDYFARKRSEFEALYQSYAHPEPSRIWWFAAIGAYILIQTPIVGPTSNERLLNIGDPYHLTECKLALFLKDKNQVSHVESDYGSEIHNSLRCHPMIAFNAAKELCGKYSTQADFVSLSATFVTRRLSEVDLQPLFTFDNICAPGTQFTLGINKHESAN